jgi:ubiquitin thioesterase CYLD
MVLPTTQQLLSLSFLQSDIKLAEVPSCLVLQMPRFGKNYKMYQRIVPSLYLDITDILDFGPRECYICGELAAFECKECFSNFELGLDQIAFCNTCLQKSHAHAKRATHMPKEIKEHPAFIEYVNQQTSLGNKSVPIRREELELFAVLCIETSHYVAFVKCGSGHDAPWLFFDSMADRMGEQHGYNIPEVKEVTEFTDWLSDSKRPYILSIAEDKLLPDLMKRILCDSYMLFYQSVDGLMYK